MTVSKVKSQLKDKYPGAAIFENSDSGEVTEILCEVDPTSKHPEYSLAVAVIDKSTPHYHKQTTETYNIIKGSLQLHVDGELVELEEGDEYTIEPGKVHWAKGDETWVECYSKPSWTPEDHILVENTK